MTGLPGCRRSSVSNSAKGSSDWGKADAKAPLPAKAPLRDACDPWPVLTPDRAPPVCHGHYRVYRAGVLEYRKEGEVGEC
jgi:hypothetical protein